MASPAAQSYTQTHTKLGSRIIVGGYFQVLTLPPSNLPNFPGRNPATMKDTCTAGMDFLLLLLAYCVCNVTHHMEDE